MIFFAILTVGFVLEIGSGALYFTNQKSSVVELRPKDNLTTPPLPSAKSERGPLWGLVLLTVISPQISNFLDIINLFSLDIETTLCLSSLLIGQESSKILKGIESTTESFAFPVVFFYPPR